MLACKEFDWSLYLKPQEDEDEESDRVTVADWLDRYQAHFFATRGQTPETEAVWKKDYYGFVFKHLSPTAELTSDLLIHAAQRPKANTRSRQYTGLLLQQLAKFAELEVDLNAYAGNYSPNKIRPREIPDDEKISTVREQFKNPAWRWVYEMMACYGLRNHEVFFTEVMTEPPYIVTITEGKTGRREIRPLYLEWAERWCVWDPLVPEVNGTHRALGDRVIKAFKRQGVPFTPYSLRHAYAIRASVVFKFPIAVAAAMCQRSRQLLTF